MSTNLATILVGLGYDLSALEKGAPEAFRLVNQQTLGMSAEMKRNSREGAESLRLIDESLGIHISRPLTRILTQEFPALASGLQAVLGGAVFGALATVGVEAFDKATRGIENAQKAEGEFNESTRKVGEVFSDAMQSFEKADKLRSLSGLDRKLFEIDSSSLEEGRKKVDELTAAMEKQAKAAAEASGWWTEFKAGVGDVAHIAFSAPSSLNADKIGEQLSGNSEKGIQSLQERFDEMSKRDALHGTHDSAQFIADKMAEAQKSLDLMMEYHATPSQTFVADNFKGLGPAIPGQMFSDEELTKQGKYLQALQQISLLIKASANDQKGREDVTKQTEALTDLRTKISLQDEYNKEVLKLSGSEYEQAHLALLERESAELRTHLTLVPEQAEEVKKLAAEIKGIQFKLIGEAQAQEVRDTQADLEGWNKESLAINARWDKINDDLAKSPLLIEASKGTMESLLGSGPGIDPFLRVWDEGKAAFSDLTARAAEFQKVWGSMTTVLSPPGPPPASDSQSLLRMKQSASGSSLGISEQDAEMVAKAQQVIDSIETPLQKYTVGLESLQELLDHNKLSTEQFAAAQQKLQEQLAESTNKLEELLKKTGDAGAGFQAFLMQLDKSANQQGAFTFDILNKGLQGFEEQTVQALTGGKTSWAKYFLDLDQMALKFMLNKGIAQLLKLPAISNALGGLTSGGGTNPTNGSTLGPTPSSIPLPPGVFGALPGVINGTNGTSTATSTATLSTAGTQLTSAATQQMSAASMLEEAASRLGAGAGVGAGAIPFPGAGGGAGDTVWSGGGAAGDVADAPVPFFAEGTDNAPGGMSWVGEQGPELVNLPAGSQVTPNAALQNLGGHTVHLHIDARGGEIGVEDKIARAISASAPQMILRAVLEANEVQRRTPR